MNGNLKLEKNYMEILKYFTTESNTLSLDYFNTTFSNKKILILGSGPSARERKWNDLQYDYIVTCNFFYKNSEVIKLKNIKHICLGDTVDLSDKDLNEFLNSNPECTISFEPKPHPFYESNLFKTFIEKYKSRVVYYVINNITTNLEGIAGRAMYFISCFQPKEVYYVGIDGTTLDKTDNVPNYFDYNLVGIRDVHYKASQQKTYHLEMGKLLCTFNENFDIRYYNLGEGLKYNMSTDISKEYYPLPNKIKKII